MDRGLAEKWIVGMSGMMSLQPRGPDSYPCVSSVGRRVLKRLILPRARSFIRQPGIRRHSGYRGSARGIFCLPFCSFSICHTRILCQKRCQKIKRRNPNPRFHDYRFKDLGISHAFCSFRYAGAIFICGKSSRNDKICLMV